MKRFAHMMFILFAFKAYANPIPDYEYTNYLNSIQKGMVALMLEHIGVSSDGKDIKVLRSSTLGTYIDGNATDRIAYLYTHIQFKTVTHNLYCEAYFPYGSLLILKNWVEWGMSTMSVNLTCVKANGSGHVAFKASIEDKDDKLFKIKRNEINGQVGTIELPNTLENIVKERLATN